MVAIAMSARIVAANKQWNKKEDMLVLVMLVLVLMLGLV
jgi:hypothetical protein